MNKRIRKKKITQKRNASRKFILSMKEGFDKDRMLMRHAILFDDYKFVHEVSGPECYIIMPRKMGRTLAYNMMYEHLNKKEYKL